MKVTVNTSRYALHYGKAPRGNGLWAFGDWKFDSGMEDGKVEFFSGSYTEAKKKAIKWAETMNIKTLFVGN